MRALPAFLIMTLIEGALVFAVAWIGTRVLGLTGRADRIRAMAVAWAGSASLLLGGYLLAGGSGALMEGMGLVLTLCVASAIGSLVTAILWVTRE